MEHNQWISTQMSADVRTLSITAMDDFALQQELESLASNAYNPTSKDEITASEPMARTIERWQKLFDIRDDNAPELIMDHRNDLTRMRVSDAHWETIRTSKEAEGYDREAYEYELNLEKKKAIAPSLMPSSEEASSVTYLIELCAPLETPEKIRDAAGLTQSPDIVTGRSLEDGRSVWLCCIDGSSKTAILRWVSSQGGDFEPTILVDPRSLNAR